MILKLERKRGVSPVVATSILIVMVIAIALIIWKFLSGFVGELMMKGDETAEAVCASGKVRMDAKILDFDSQDVIIENRGNIWIEQLIVSVKGGGSSQTQVFTVGIGAGDSKEVRLNKDEISLEGCESVVMTPVMLARGKSVKVFPCETEAVTEFCPGNE